MKLLPSEIPSDSMCLLKGPLLKLDPNFEWKLFVSPDHLLFSRPGTKFVFDSVPLLDITHVEPALDDNDIPSFVDHHRAEPKLNRSQSMLQES
jgi:hypothetical protein